MTVVYEPYPGAFDDILGKEDQITDEMATAFAIGAKMGEGCWVSDHPTMQRALNSSKERIKSGLAMVFKDVAALQPVSVKSIDSACLSYRHDFGLLSEEQKNKVRFQATEWSRAFEVRKPLSSITQPAQEPQDSVAVQPAGYITVIHDDTDPYVFHQTEKEALEFSKEFSHDGSGRIEAVIWNTDHQAAMAEAEQLLKDEETSHTNYATLLREDVATQRKRAETALAECQKEKASLELRLDEVTADRDRWYGAHAECKKREARLLEALSPLKNIADWYDDIFPDHECVAFPGITAIRTYHEHKDSPTVVLTLGDCRRAAALSKQGEQG